MTLQVSLFWSSKVNVNTEKISYPTFHIVSCYVFKKDFSKIWIPIKIRITNQNIQFPSASDSKQVDINQMVNITVQYPDGTIEEIESYDTYERYRR